MVLRSVKREKLVRRRILRCSPSCSLSNYIDVLSRISFDESHTIKVGGSPSGEICLICFKESLLKKVKNAFYFILNFFLFSEYLNVCLDFLVMQKKRLD